VGRNITLAIGAIQYQVPGILANLYLRHVFSRGFRFAGRQRRPVVNQGLSQTSFGYIFAFWATSYKSIEQVHTTSLFDKPKFDVGTMVLLYYIS
jgi:hypothetical protein